MQGTRRSAQSGVPGAGMMPTPGTQGYQDNNMGDGLNKLFSIIFGGTAQKEQETSNVNRTPGFLNQQNPVGQMTPDIQRFSQGSTKEMSGFLNDKTNPAAFVNTDSLGATSQVQQGAQAAQGTNAVFDNFYKIMSSAIEGIKAQMNQLQVPTVGVR